VTGIVDLDILLQNMEPQLLESEFVFVSSPSLTLADIQALQAKASFQEAEGLSLVLERAVADSRGLSYSGVFRCISLTVHSSLEAVGLTAAFATALAEKGISANVVAATHHDHLFVPQADADRAMAALLALSAQNSTG
jgi:hypothetical protein